MGRSSLKITGLSEARTSLRALARDFDAQVVAPAIAEALGPVQRRVIAEAPRATGDLAGHVVIVTHPPKAGHVRAEVMVQVPYAGHRDLGTDDLAPDDFVERAFAATARNAADRVEQRIRSAVS